MSRRKISTKEFATYDGVRMSFIATINLAKHTWDMVPSEAFEWYVDHLEKRRRYLTLETAQTYREALEADFETWIEKNNRKSIKAPVATSYDDEQAAIMYLLDRGYTITKR